MLGVYTGGISGAHLNPAVTFANCVFRKFPWRKFPIYLVAQVLGAMCASGVVYANYKSAIDVFEGGANIRTVPGYSETATAGIFCTYPQPFMTKTGQFFSEFIASSILMFLIYALKDDGNIGAGNLVPLGLFFVIFGIGACFGWETGYAINLARDFGPRLMSYMLGYGPHVWKAGNYYFWVNIFFSSCLSLLTSSRSPWSPRSLAVPLAAGCMTCSSSRGSRLSTRNVWDWRGCCIGTRRRGPTHTSLRFSE
jgi:aquaglyceroporin related protein